MNNRGFTLIEGLLIIVVLSIIGFGAFYVYDKQNDESKDNSQNTTANTQIKDSQKETSSQAKKYEITELGVSIETGGTDTLIYELLDESTEGVISVGFTTQGDIEIDPSCDGKAAYGGILTKAPKDKEYLDGTLYRDSADAQVIGDYVYVYAPPQSPCLFGDENTLTIVPSIKESIADTLKPL